VKTWQYCQFILGESALWVIKLANLVDDLAANSHIIIEDNSQSPRQRIRTTLLAV